MGKWVHRLAEVDLQAKTAVCANCWPVSIRVKKTKDGNPRPRCGLLIKEQNRKWAKTPTGRAVVQRSRDAGLEPHGLTVGAAREYRQSVGCCEICGGIQRLSVDHSHTTGTVRGVLCHRCNVGLGMFKDNIESLRSAINYLENRE